MPAIDKFDKSEIKRGIDSNFNQLVHCTNPQNDDLVNLSKSNANVVVLDDELKEIMKEIVRNDALDKVLIGLDFFDASINRIAAWVIGTRNAQKALLWALLQPHEAMKKMQDEADFTRRLMMMEEMKTMPFSDIWTEYCNRQGVPADSSWYDVVMEYEKNVLEGRK